MKTTAFSHTADQAVGCDPAASCGPDAGCDSATSCNPATSCGPDASCNPATSCGPDASCYPATSCGPEATPAAIETFGLTKTYGKARGIESLNLTVRQGAFYGFIGPNGAGKSTTIRLLLGLLTPTGGTARVLGMDIMTQRQSILSLTGYLPSEISFYTGMKVKDVLRLSADLRKGALAAPVSGMVPGSKQPPAPGCAPAVEHSPSSEVEPASSRTPASSRASGSSRTSGSGWASGSGHMPASSWTSPRIDDAYTLQLCERLQLDLSKKVETLSLGNRKKVAIVCALQHRPPLLILDEPTSGLDPLIQQEFFQILKEHHRDGATIFLSSHVLSEIQHYCDSAAIIREGRIVKSGGMDELVKAAAKRVTLRIGGAADSPSGTCDSGFFGATGSPAETCGYSAGVCRAADFSATAHDSVASAHGSAGSAGSVAASAAGPLAPILAELPGVHNLQLQSCAASFLYSGDINRLTAALAAVSAAAPIQDLTITEPNLEEVFLEYYKEVQNDDTSKA